MLKIDEKLVSQIASLAKLSLSKEEKEKLTSGFNKTLEIINELFRVDVSKVSPVYQVTNLENVLREDIVDEEKMLSQDEALSQAKRKYKGYFVVNQILKDD